MFRKQLAGRFARRIPYTWGMDTQWNPKKLHVVEFAKAEQSLSGLEPLQNYARLMLEIRTQSPLNPVKWSAKGFSRPVTGSPDERCVDLHLETTLFSTCQRCMGELELPMALTHRFVFVKDESTAEALDEAAGDEFEEDFLAASKEFDLHNLIEEELILAMPFIPMHDTCPEEVPLQSSDADFRAALSSKPNAFAVLGSLKKG